MLSKCPPVARLPGHKKASVAVKFSPILYDLRAGVTGAESPVETKTVAIERGSDKTVDVDIVDRLSSRNLLNPHVTMFYSFFANETVVLLLKLYLYLCLLYIKHFLTPDKPIGVYDINNKVVFFDAGIFYKQSSTHNALQGDENAVTSTCRPQSI